jgi:hypothetical protein
MILRISGGAIPPTVINKASQKVTGVFFGWTRVSAIFYPPQFNTSLFRRFWMATYADGLF